MSARLRGITGALALLMLGCVHTGTARERAAFDLGCPQESLEVTEDHGVFRAVGCGRSASYDCRTEQMESHCKNAGSVPLAAADSDVPSGATSEGAAMNRAVLDLACAEEKLTTVTLDPRTVGVRGCGKRISYVCHQRFWRYWCDADSPVEVDAR